MKGHFYSFPGPAGGPRPKMQAAAAPPQPAGPQAELRLGLGPLGPDDASVRSGTNRKPRQAGLMILINMKPGYSTLNQQAGRPLHEPESHCGRCVGSRVAES